MLQVKDIPQELLDKINEQFDRDPKVGQMRVRQQMLIRSCKYQEALEVAQALEELRSRAVYEYIAESERQIERIDVADMDMPVENKERMMQLALVCFMCSDMIESAVQDMDDILHKYDKDLHVAMFNDIREVMSMTEAKLKYLYKNSGYMKDLTWAGNCDNMYKMAQNKAAAIIRKRKSDPNWGENMKRFDKN